MLVLSRQRDETIMIGDEVEVTVVDIRGDKVRLGITAPKEVTVHRKEVYEAIKRENRAAAQVRPEDLPGNMGNPHASGPKLAGDPNRPQVRPTVRAASPQPVRPAKPERPARRERRGGGSPSPSQPRAADEEQQQQPAQDVPSVSSPDPESPRNGD